MPIFDLSNTPLRELNSALHALSKGANDTEFEVINPRGSHAVADSQGASERDSMSSPAPTSSVDTRQYLLERVDDAAVVQLYADGFRLAFFKNTVSEFCMIRCGELIDIHQHHVIANNIMGRIIYIINHDIVTDIATDDGAVI